MGTMEELHLEELSLRMTQAKMDDAFRAAMQRARTLIVPDWEIMPKDSRSFGAHAAALRGPGLDRASSFPCSLKTLGARKQHWG